MRLNAEVPGQRLCLISVVLAAALAACGVCDDRDAKPLVTEGAQSAVTPRSRTPEADLWRIVTLLDSGQEVDEADILGLANDLPKLADADPALARYAFIRLGSRAHEAEGQLVEYLSASDSKLRELAAEIVSVVGVSEAGLRAQAINLLASWVGSEDDEEERRVLGLWALMKLAPRHLPSAAQVGLADLVAPERQLRTRLHAYAAIARYSSADLGMQDAAFLVECVNCDDLALRKLGLRAIRELSKARPSLTVALLRNLLASPVVWTQRQAVRTLAEMGPSAESACDDLRALLASAEDRLLRLYLERSLAALGCE